MLCVGRGGSSSKPLTVLVPNTPAPARCRSYGSGLGSGRGDGHCDSGTRGSSVIFVKDPTASPGKGDQERSYEWEIPFKEVRRRA